MLLGTREIEVQETVVREEGDSGLRSHVIQCGLNTGIKSQKLSVRL